mgnify:CR=1 FL=1
MKFKYALGLLTILNSGLIFGASFNDKYYKETYERLSREHYPKTESINKALDGARVFDLLESNAHCSVAKDYLTARLMRLPIEDFQSIFKKHQDLFLNTLVGRNLILGWMVHSYDNPSKLFQFSRDTHSYDLLFKVMGEKTKAISIVNQLQPLADDGAISIVRQLNH